MHALKRHHAGLAVPLVVMTLLAACSREEAPSPQGEAPPPVEAQPSLGNPAELALLGAAHRHFQENVTFSDETISDSSGEKRVCGHITFDGRTEQYVFSLSRGVIRQPNAETWQASCAHAWTPGQGF